MMADFLAFMEAVIKMAGGPAMFGVHLLGALLAFGAIAVLSFAQFNKDSKFDAAEMLEENGHTSATAFLKLIGGMASIWVIVDLTVSDKLSTEVFTIWLGLILANSLGQKAIDRWRAPPPPPPEKTTAKGEAK